MSLVSSKLTSTSGAPAQRARQSAVARSGGGTSGCCSALAEHGRCTAQGRLDKEPGTRGARRGHIHGNGGSGGDESKGGTAGAAPRPQGRRRCRRGGQARNGTRLRQPSLRRAARAHCGSYTLLRSASSVQQSRITVTTRLGSGRRAPLVQATRAPCAAQSRTAGCARQRGWAHRRSC